MSTDLITLERDETLNLAEEVMRLARIRHLPVTEGARLVGLITHRDLLRAQSSNMANLTDDERREVQSTVKAGDIMRGGVTTCRADTSVLEAAKILRQQKFGCLPVVDEDHKLLGIITEADFLDLVIRALEDAERN
jgi:CBS domain-containing membrane protein